MLGPLRRTQRSGLHPPVSQTTRRQGSAANESNTWSERGATPAPRLSRILGIYESNLNLTFWLTGRRKFIIRTSTPYASPIAFPSVLVAARGTEIFTG